MFEVFSGPELYGRWPNADEGHNVSAVYLTTGWSGQLGAPGPGKTANRASFAPPVRPVLTRFAERLREVTG